MCLSTFEETIKLKYIFSPLAGNNSTAAVMAYSSFKAGGREELGGKMRDNKSETDVMGGKRREGKLYILVSYFEWEMILICVVIVLLDNCCSPILGS